MVYFVRTYQRQNLCVWALKYVLIVFLRGPGRVFTFFSIPKALVSGEMWGKGINSHP